MRKLNAFFASAVAAITLSTVEPAEAAKATALQCGPGYAYINKPLEAFARKHGSANSLMITFTNLSPGLVGRMDPSSNVNTTASYIISPTQMLIMQQDHKDMTREVGTSFPASNLVPLIFHETTQSLLRNAHVPGGCKSAPW